MSRRRVHTPGSPVRTSYPYLVNQSERPLRLVRRTRTRVHTLVHRGALVVRVVDTEEGGRWKETLEPVRNYRLLKEKVTPYGTTI